MKLAARDRRNLMIGSQLLLSALRAEHPLQVLPAVPQRVSIRGLVTHAARLSEIALERIVARDGPGRRTREIVRVRRAIALIAYEQRDADGQHAFSLPEIGRLMAWGNGAFDHSSVIHWRNTGWALERREPEFARFVERLRAAAECEPLGPGAERVLAQPVPVELVAGRLHAVATVPLIRLPASVAEEYTSRHALPLLADEDGDEERQQVWRERSVRAGSAALLRALKQHHPERFAA